MKNIAVFASREHHAQKLGNIFNKLDENEGNTVFWLTCNNSINLDSPLEFLIPSGARFAHVYDQQLTDREKKDIDVLTKKILKKVINVSAYMTPFWAIHSSLEMAQLTVLFKKFITENRINGIVVLHNANFFSRILSFIAQKENVPVFSFQEGMLRDRDQTAFNKQVLSTDYATKTFCWSQSDVNKYKEAGSKGSLVIGGLHHLDNMPTVDKSTAKVIAFMPTVASEYKGSIVNDAKWILSYCVQAGVEFIFKPHPFEKSSYMNTGLLVSEATTNEILVYADYIISQHSSIMVEASVLGKNVAELNRTMALSTESLSGSAYATINNEETLASFVDNGFNAKKWVKQMGYKIGNRTNYIVKEIEKCL